MLVTPGGGWWSSCLGSGNRIVDGTCDDSSSVAVQSSPAVQLRSVGGIGHVGHVGHVWHSKSRIRPSGSRSNSTGDGSLCVTVTAPGNLTLIEEPCSASLQQLWTLDPTTGLLSSGYALGECLRAAAGGGLVLESCDGGDPWMLFLPHMHAYCTGDTAGTSRWRCVTLREGPNAAVTFSSEPDACEGGGLGCAMQAFDGKFDVSGVGDGGGGDGTIINLNYWHTHVDAELPQWISYDLGANVALCSYSIVARSASCCHGTDSPRDWQLRGYDPMNPAAGYATDQINGWDVLDVVWNEAAWESAEKRTYILVPGRLHQLYKLHVTSVGDNSRGVLALAELQLHRATTGGGSFDSNFVCSNSQKWSAKDPNAVTIISNITVGHPDYVAPLFDEIDFSVRHMYSLDLRADGVIEFLFDNTVVRSWSDDSLQLGTIGFGNGCRESTIEEVIIHQVCEVTLRIHVEGKGYDTRWNIDR